MVTTYDCYSTFVNSGQFSLVQQDGRYKDGSVFTNGLFGTDFPVTYMVSDNVQPPNNDVTKSWSQLMIVTLHSLIVDNLV